MADLCLKNVTVNINGTARLHDVSLALQPRELVALVGPNGAGKSSLLQTALGILPASCGAVTVNGIDSSSLTALERARLVSYLPQTRPLAWPVLVRDTVALGRFAYGASPGKLALADQEAVTAAISDCDIEHLADRRTDQLSGGELARVHCARAFAARTPILLADEPVAALDPNHQLRIMSLLRKYVENGGSALVVMHDLNLAARYADKLVWMKKGSVKANGTVKNTLNTAHIEEIFDVYAEVDLDQERPTISIVAPLQTP